MTCCEEKPFGSEIYLPLNEKLLEYGKNMTSPDVLNTFPDTFMWLFSFFKKDDLECVECADNLSKMVQWVDKYNLLKSPTRNFKWIFDVEMEKNNISIDIGITKTPTHILADKNGRILDMFLGIPNEEFLNKHLLPYFSKDLFDEK